MPVGGEERNSDGAPNVFGFDWVRISNGQNVDILFPVFFSFRDVNCSLLYILALFAEDALDDASLLR